MIVFGSILIVRPLYMYALLRYIFEHSSVVITEGSKTVEGPNSFMWEYDPQYTRNLLVSFVHLIPLTI